MLCLENNVYHALKDANSVVLWNRKLKKKTGEAPKCQQSWPRCKEMVNGTRWSVFWLYDNVIECIFDAK